MNILEATERFLCWVRGEHRGAQRNDGSSRCLDCGKVLRSPSGKEQP